jgi:leucine dehydrogenase
VSVLAELEKQGHEQVIVFRDGPSGLRGFLAIHSTALGPAFGGVRIMTYRREQDALADALRLARGMTYKCALAELPAGGGKAVILDRRGLQRERAFEAFGRVVESLGGRFFTGGDVGIRPADLAHVRRSTTHVACESSPELGDINEHTAMGVWHAMRGCLEHLGLEPAGARVAIQGVGNVGAWLARILAREGCAVTVADRDAALARRVAGELGARAISAARVLAAECDVLAPCALGGVLSARTIPALRCRVVCGAANNQLATPADGDRLARRGILYAPDYLANAGGVLRGVEFYLLGRRESWTSLERQRDRMLRVAREAAATRRSTARVADALAEGRYRLAVTSR